MLELRLLFSFAAALAVATGCAFLGASITDALPNNWIGEWAFLLVVAASIGLSGLAFWQTLVRTEPKPGRPRHGD